MLRAQRRAPRHRHVLVGEHRQHAVADQLQHLAAGVMDGVDRGLRIVVEERDDLVRPDALADRGRAAQIGEPQHRLDPLGHAARDASAQHLLGGVAAEIDPPERSRDLDLRRGFDREPQHRHQVAQAPPCSARQSLPSRRSSSRNRSNPSRRSCRLRRSGARRRRNACGPCRRARRSSRNRARRNRRDRSRISSWPCSSM